VDDYTGEELMVTRSIWKTVINRPKTRASRQAVPVIAELARILGQCQKSMCHLEIRH